MGSLVLTHPWRRSLLHIARNLRRMDMLECWAAYGPKADPFAMFEMSAQQSERVWCVQTWYGQPVAAFGVARPTLLGDSGVIWLQATDEFARFGKSGLRLGREILEQIHSRFAVIFNFVHAEHSANLRWLDRLGFEIWPAAPYGILAKPFHKVVRRRAEQCVTQAS